MRPRLLAAWQRYWFTPASLTDLGVSRVVLAAIVLWLDGMEGRAIQAAFVPSTYWAPIPLLQTFGIDQPGLDTLRWVGRINFVLLLAVLLGVFARPALALLLPVQLFIEALPNCFGKVSHGTIPILYALAFFLAGPSDRAFALGAVWRRARTAGRSPGPPPAISRLSPDARWPLDLLFIELASYYCLAGISKLRDSGFLWADGYTLQYYMLTMPAPWGHRLAEHLGLCTALSILVLSFELGAPLGIIRRLRPLVLAGGVLFHLGTRWFMNIWFWPIVALYALFVPWTRLGTALARGIGLASRSLIVHYDGDCAACRRLVSVLHDLDLAGTIRFTADGNPGHLALTPGGLAGSRRLATALPLAWPLLPALLLPGASWLCSRIARVVARRHAHAHASA
jgi:hypothetical protein